MGHRGWLLFVYKGNYYIIYNHWSYPAAMGVSIVKQLTELLSCYHGDIKQACAHWGELLCRQKYTVEDGPNLHPFNADCAYSNIAFKLRDFSSPIKLEQEVSSSITAEISQLWHEFFWEINLDSAQLVASQPMHSVDFKVDWSFKSLYRLLDKPEQSEHYLKMWLADADSYSIKRESENDKDGRYMASISVTDKFGEEYAALLIQTQYRRYRSFKQALVPPNGMLFLLAQKRFVKTSKQPAPAEAPGKRPRSDDAHVVDEPSGQQIRI